MNTPRRSASQELHVLYEDMDMALKFIANRFMALPVFLSWSSFRQHTMATSHRHTLINKETDTCTCVSHTRCHCAQKTMSCLTTPHPAHSRRTCLLKDTPVAVSKRAIEWNQCLRWGQWDTPGPFYHQFDPQQTYVFFNLPIGPIRPFP